MELLITGVFIAGIILVFIIVSANSHIDYITTRKADKKKSDLQFAELKSSLQLNESEYQYFVNEHDKIWIETSIDAVREMVMGSYVYTGSTQRDYYHYVFQYKIDELSRKVYFAVFDSTVAPEEFDWKSLIHHQEWIDTPNPINARVAEYQAKQRQRRKGAPWWKFWAYSKFD